MLAVVWVSPFSFLSLCCQHTLFVDCILAPPTCFSANSCCVYPVGIAFGQVGKQLGERWKALPAKERVQYDQQAEKDKERYTKAMASYKGGAPAEEDDEDDS